MESNSLRYLLSHPSWDGIRSYHINTDKIKRVLSFEPQHTIEEALRDLCQAFCDGKLSDSFDDGKYYNVRTMQAIGTK